MKRILFIILWLIVFTFLAAFISGFCVGIFLAGVSYLKLQNSENIKGFIAILWALIILSSGVAGLLLGIFGKLPGTKQSQAHSR